jgi:hypothetical protein
MNTRSKASRHYGRKYASPFNREVLLLALLSWAVVYLAVRMLP